MKDELKAIIGMPFKSASHLNISRKHADIIRKQPGYYPGKCEYYVLLPATGGGLRLYACVNGQLMDASLASIE